MQVVENVKVTSNYITVYDTVIDGTPQVRGESATVNFTDTFHDCQMRNSAIKSIKKAANIIVAIAKKNRFNKSLRPVGCTSYRKPEVYKNAAKNARNGYLATFVTLTLPYRQLHTDTEITKYCLNAFFAYARKYFHVKYFIWKKELQKNGNLHYHIMCDRYIDHEYLRRAWNRILNKGAVKDCIPFCYIDLYHEKWTQFYSNGFDADKVAEYVASLPSIQTEIQQKAERNLMDSYDTIFQQVIDREVARYRRIYDDEMKEPDPGKRFRNPNSTDIQAVRNPALVAAYLAKYMAKDVDETPEIKNYWDYVKWCKDQIYMTLREIKKCKDANEDYTNLSEYAATMTQHLEKYRALHCPILGNLWYKSSSLTPYMSGITDIIHSRLYEELKQLSDYLAEVEIKRNAQRAIAGKSPVPLIRYVYEKTPDGKEDKSKVICVTLLMSCFELNTVRDKGGKLRFPLLSRLWNGYFNVCRNYNQKRDLYFDFRRKLRHSDKTMRRLNRQTHKCLGAALCPLKALIKDRLVSNRDRWQKAIQSLAAELAEYRRNKFTKDPILKNAA
jgi:hypothetical protein